VAAAVALLTIGDCKEAVAVVPQLIEVLDDPKQPAIVRWRLLWSLRVHQGALKKYDKLFSAMSKALTEPGLKEAKSGKMLRYDCAFLLSVLWQKEAPDAVLPVLQDFLHDDTIRIYTGITGTVGGAKVEGSGGSKGTVSEEGFEDGRIMAIEALDRLGHQRVMAHPEIIAQLQKMAANNSKFEDRVREKSGNLLTKWGVK
jgi:hypothetical protein